MATNLIKIHRQFNTQVLKDIKAKLDSGYKLLLVLAYDKTRSTQDNSNYTKTLFSGTLNSNVTVMATKEITNAKIAIPALEDTSNSSEITYLGKAYKTKSLSAVDSDNKYYNHLYLTPEVTAVYEYNPVTGSAMGEGELYYNITAIVLTNITHENYDATENSSNEPNFTESGKDVIVLAQSNHANVILTKADDNGFPPTDIQKTLYIMLKV